MAGVCKLRCFISCPRFLPSGRITRCAACALEVDLKWQNGKLATATIRATRDGSFRLDADGKIGALTSLKKGEAMEWPEAKEST